jgi:4-carboxymuconolactone decarboxylase
MPQQHERALGAWQAELAEWPQLLMSAHGSVRAMAGALPGLQVDAARMRANIDRLRAELPRDAADEWFDPALAVNAGQTALAEVKALQARSPTQGTLSMTAPQFPARRLRLPPNATKSGLLNRRRVLGDAWVDKSLANRNEFNAEFQELITRHAWNDIWGRPALGDKTRRYMVLSMMLGIHAYEEFAMHVRAALDGPPESRLTPDDIKEVIMMAAIYCGVPVANHAFGIATGILREKGLLARRTRACRSAATRERAGRPGRAGSTSASPCCCRCCWRRSRWPPTATCPRSPPLRSELGSASTSLTLFVLAFGFAQLLCGPLADRFGRRPVLLAGLAATRSRRWAAPSRAAWRCWRAGARCRASRWRPSSCARAPRCATCTPRTKART